MLKHYTGHRNRIKNKFLNNEDSFSDYELLELMLFYSIPRKDVKELAKQLINHFGSLNNILTAQVDDFKDFKGISQNSITLFKLTYKMCKEILKKEVYNKPVISNWEQLTNYCFVNLAFEKNEQVYIIYLNSKNHIIKDELLNSGSINYATINIREVIEKSLKLGAASIILVHNHPSGDYTPSKEDIKLTKEISEIGGRLNLFLFDHLIISKKGVYSFRDNGLL